MTGGVEYVAEEPLRQAQGEAAEGGRTSTRRACVKHVMMTGAVHVHERMRVEMRCEGSGREFRGRSCGVSGIWCRSRWTEYGCGCDRKMQLRDAKATGDARLKVVNRRLRRRRADIRDRPRVRCPGMC